MIRILLKFIIIIFILKEGVFWCDNFLQKYVLTINDFIYFHFSSCKRFVHMTSNSFFRFYMMWLDYVPISSEIFS